MKISEIRKLPTSDLTVKSNELKQEIIELRKQIVMGELHNVRQIRNKRRDLARVLTVLSEQLVKENI